MKRSIVTLSSFLAIFALVLFTGCEGPAGENGNDTCEECHNIANQNLKSAEYELSGHAAGANVGYAGGRNACAACHSHEGYVETQHTGRDTTAANIPIPTRIDCETCHENHSTFSDEDEVDYAIRGGEPVKLAMFADKTVDFGKSSNLCASCHQPRREGPTADENGEFRITSTHWGPHHGPQATYLQGIGAYEVNGSVSYPAEGSSAHAGSGACVSCHMGESTNDGGGHTFAANVASCTACHSDATTMDINGVQTEVAGLLEDLADILKAKGVLDNEGHVVPGKYDVDLAGAYYNYIGIEEDRSLGVHNPAYIKAVLKNTIAAID